MRGYLHESRKAISTYKTAHHFIIEHRLYYWMLAPIILNVLLFIGFISLGWGYADIISNFLFDLVNIESWELGKLQFLIDIFKFLLALIIQIISLLIYLSLIKYLMLILLAPLLAYLSEKTEELYTGKSYPFKLGLFIKNILRGTLVAIKNIFLEILITIVFGLLTFVPIIGLSSPLLTFMAESYFFGYSMIDYYCERRQMSISQGTRFINQHFSFTLINGLIFNLFLLLPSIAALFPILLIGVLLKYFIILPIIVLSIVPVYSIVAATIGILDIEKEKLNAG
jgi:CysZ protein